MIPNDYGYIMKQTDTDDDGLSDYEEHFIHKTNPLVADTDGDGINDGYELKYNLNPLSLDSNDNGVPDSEENLNKL